MAVVVMVVMDKKCWKKGMGVNLMEVPVVLVVTVDTFSHTHTDLM